MQMNEPGLWEKALPWPPMPAGHKYDRGHALMAGGAVMTGAIRMAAQAAMRIGAGLCTVAAPGETAGMYQADAPHIIVRPVKGLAEFVDLADKVKPSALLIGPGLGRDDPQMTRQVVLDFAARHSPLVLDADAMNVFEGVQQKLYKALHSKCILTPHEGEFERLFPDLEGDRAGKALRAAERCDCVVVLKGAETVIAAPGQGTVVNRHASPWLATAGAGDVLAGMVTGLLAQKIPAFEAACAAVWMHGEAGQRGGPGLVAPDLIGMIPAIMRDFA